MFFTVTVEAYDAPTETRISRRRISHGKAWNIRAGIAKDVDVGMGKPTSSYQTIVEDTQPCSVVLLESVMQSIPTCVLTLFQCNRLVPVLSLYCVLIHFKVFTHA